MKCGNGIFVPSLLFVNQTQPEIDAITIRFQIKKLLINVDGLVVLSRVMKDLTQISLCGERQRIKFQTASGLRNCSIRLAVDEQIERIPLMGLRVIRIEFDGALECCFGLSPLKAVHVGVGKGDIRFSQGVVNLQGTDRCFFRHRKGVFRKNRRQTNIAAERIAVADAGIGQRIVWIDGDRLLKAFEPFLQSFDGALVPMVAAFEIELVSFSVFRIASD